MKTLALPFHIAFLPLHFSIDFLSVQFSISSVKTLTHKKYISFSGKANTADSEIATSLVFNQINGLTYLLALYRDDHLRMWSATTQLSVCSISCVRDTNEPRMQGRKYQSGGFKVLIFFFFKIFSFLFYQ